MAKEVAGLIKLQIKGGASPSDRGPRSRVGVVDMGPADRRTLRDHHLHLATTSQGDWGRGTTPAAPALQDPFLLQRAARLKLRRS